MTVFDSVVLGTIEGFTEYLPVSSTGHLIVASKFLGVHQTSVNKAFEVIIQFAAIMAVVFNYTDKFTLKHLELWKKVFVAFLPIGIIGFLFAHQAQALFSVNVVAVMFILGGIVFIVVEKFFVMNETTMTTDIENVSYKQALLIGFAQVAALIPGTSRAGATIVGALLVGLNRKASAEFSFLLAFPVMSAATGYDLVKHFHEFSTTNTNFTILLIGFVISFIVAYLTIKLFIKFLEKFTFIAFGVYRIIFGALLLMLAFH
jgi:undecaprenyl-diphosphatase